MESRESKPNGPDWTWHPAFVAPEPAQTWTWHPAFVAPEPAQTRIVPDVPETRPDSRAALRRKARAERKAAKRR